MRTGHVSKLLLGALVLSHANRTCFKLVLDALVLLPNALYKLILRILAVARPFCNFWVYKRATEKNYWPVTWQMTSRNVKYLDVNDEYRHSVDSVSAISVSVIWNNCVIKQLFQGYLGSSQTIDLRPLATVSQIFSTTSGQKTDCSPRSHEINEKYLMRTGHV